MKIHLFIIISLSVVLSLCISCRNKGDSAEIDDPSWYNEADASGLPRLVISGQINNTNHEALSGIYVSVFGVRQEMETNIITYNYAVSDSLGQYLIIRYRGRELPAEVTLVATDSTGLYQEQLRVCEIIYDSVFIEREGRNIPYNGYVTADFVLSQ